jgi:hypothetical protein
MGHARFLVLPRAILVVLASKSAFDEIAAYGSSTAMVNVDRMPPTLQHLRRYAIARSLFKPTTLRRAIEKLGFLQADPIRAPARAQDLTLRQRVVGYRAGDLERRYPRLALEEDYFVN